ncbi:transport-associated domain-containing protein [Ehrlichia ruminantium]|uniref:BON domain-containing protein n=1 Tax=Ehrlichia ruminantium (strain Welgevonden) TaxID=254945 RepID=A0A0H3M6H8_EHRRW|nr:BON domain-containing protein [Ehrlichia ruminantium]KYX00067.1 BON domain-containing protein [Ehrlichia ruminantium]QLK50745.1 BON domain-containing protein [Ehrlichia ruminantium]QLK51668.1 BON domain-containing protein [Ehrlichia ruminantium]QLK52593.1 BON domain-containing protein [Ehrlichia ruminantium]QLK53506.1 BON domain-containing protein [Ehrlichia ruminantium]
MRFFINLLLVALLLINQTGCSGIMAGLAVTTGAIITLQDKSIGDTIDDTAILIRINKELFNAGLFPIVTVKVSEGRVLLIGNVKSSEDQIKAEKIAWHQKDVKEVVNEIVVDKESINIKEAAVDAMISAQVKARILSQSKVRSMNYSVNTVNGTVYLMGIAQNQAELDKVVAIARKVKKVKQVISYVRLKDSRLRNNQNS